MTEEIKSVIAKFNRVCEALMDATKHHPHQSMNPVTQLTEFFCSRDPTFIPGDLPDDVAKSLDVKRDFARSTMSNLVIDGDVSVVLSAIIAAYLHLLNTDPENQQKVAAYLEDYLSWTTNPALPRGVLFGSKYEKITTFSALT